ncbi:hypothetical protein QCN29_34970 [Streptomyces sp. HNM0663]|uniref:Uncharacterized protein n=1 Tax=Streptomyces chengmaiensis TaxID=3040919 RepID=A0ABT6HYS7_9ACTN|nr:hypothetical protein [Streptomyces chengmaiensis]MDH2393869.1 hypothetical protein [Streptomyces chengmaiensis]
MAAAVSYVDDDLDLPLPDPGFRDHVTQITAQDTSGHSRSAPLPHRERKAAPSTAAGTVTDQLACTS